MEAARPSETSYQIQNESSSITALCNHQHQRVLLSNRSLFRTPIIHTSIPDIYLASTVALIQSVILCTCLHAVLIKTKQREWTATTIALRHSIIKLTFISSSLTNKIMPDLNISHPLFPSLISQNASVSFFPQKALYSGFLKSSIETLVSWLLKTQQKRISLVEERHSLKMVISVI